MVVVVEVVYGGVAGLLLERRYIAKQTSKLVLRCLLGWSEVKMTARERGRERETDREGGREREREGEREREEWQKE